MPVNYTLYKFLHTLYPLEIGKIRSRLAAQPLRLFESMLGMKEFDREALRKEFPECQIAAFSALKSRLLDKCLSTLAESQSLADRPDKVVEAVRRIAVLIDRRFQYEARKRIRRFLKLALGLEMFGTVCDLIDLERSIGGHAHTTRKPEHAARMQKLEAGAIRKLAEYCEKKAFHARVKEIAASPEETRRPEVERAMQAIPDPATCLSFRSRLTLALARAELYRLAARRDDAVLAVEEIIALIEAHPKFLEDPAVRRSYRAFLFEGGCAAIASRDFQKLEARTEKLRWLQSAYRQETGDEIGEMLIYLKLEAAKARLDETAALEAMDALAEKLEDDTGEFHISRRVRLFFLSAEWSICLGRYREASAWLHRLADVGDETELAMIAYSKLLMVIVYFQRDMPELLDSALRHARYFFRTRNCNTDFERAVLRFFGMARNAYEDFQRRALLEALREDVVRLLDDPAYRRHREAFHLTAWIDAQLTGRPMMEVLREKAGDGTNGMRSATGPRLPDGTIRDTQLSASF